MRKTFILLVLFAGCLFGGTPNEDLVAAGQKCDIDGVKDAVARGADINKEYIMQKNISGEIENYRTTVSSYVFSIFSVNCRNTFKYLVSVKEEQEQLLELEKFWADKGWADKDWAKKRLNELTGIDKDFFSYLLVSRGSSLSVIKQLYIEKGADKNLVVDERGGKVLMLFANNLGANMAIAEVALYLSSIGADSYGVMYLQDHFYKKPKIFEDKNIEMRVHSVSWGGGQI